MLVTFQGRMGTGPAGAPPDPVADGEGVRPSSQEPPFHQHCGPRLSDLRASRFGPSDLAHLPTLSRRMNDEMLATCTPLGHSLFLDNNVH